MNECSQPLPLEPELDLMLIFRGRKLVADFVFHLVEAFGIGRSYVFQLEDVVRARLRSAEDIADLADLEFLELFADRRGNLVLGHDAEISSVFGVGIVTDSLGDIFERLALADLLERVLRALHARQWHFCSFST